MKAALALAASVPKRIALKHGFSGTWAAYGASLLLSAPVISPWLLLAVPGSCWLCAPGFLPLTSPGFAPLGLRRCNALVPRRLACTDGSGRPYTWTPRVHKTP